MSTTPLDTKRGSSIDGGNPKKKVKGLSIPEKGLSVSQLVEIQYEIYKEIIKCLDYESNEQGYRAFRSNKKLLDYLKFPDLLTKVDEERVKKKLKRHLRRHFFLVAKKIFTLNGKDPKKEPYFFGKYFIALAIRVAMIYASLKPVGNSTGLEYYPALPNLECFEGLTPVILRQEDKDFWQECLTRSAERKICSVGGPGIGKTTTTFYLLQQIVLEKKRTVVYAVQEVPPQKTVYMIFTPTNLDDNGTIISASCVESDKGPGDVHSWCDGDYYVVDPGATKVTCDFRFAKNVHVILVCSCDERLWGAREFEKMRSRGSRNDVDDGVDDDVDDFWFIDEESDDEQRVEERTLGGQFVYCNSWKLRDLVNAKQILGLQYLSDEEICYRYRVTGGSVRKIIDFDFDEQKLIMTNALSDISKEKIKELSEGKCYQAFNPNASESSLVSVQPDRNNPTIYRLEICSDFAAELIAEKHLQMSWYKVLDEQSACNRGNLFESFVRKKLSQGINLSMDRDSLPAAPQNSKSKKKNYQKSSTKIELEKMRIERVTNLAQSVRTGSPEILYYSKDESEPFIDMICQYDGGFFAIQATIQRTHDAATCKIRALVDALQCQKLVIVYVVPMTRLSEFETTPVNPLLCDRELAKIVDIHHMGIEDDS